MSNLGTQSAGSRINRAERVTNYELVDLLLLDRFIHINDQAIYRWKTRLLNAGGRCICCWTRSLLRACKRTHIEHGSCRYTILYTCRRQPAVRQNIRIISLRMRKLGQLRVDRLRVLGYTAYLRYTVPAARPFWICHVPIPDLPYLAYKQANESQYPWELPCYSADRACSRATVACGVWT